MRTGRDFPAIEDACARAMTIESHHEWVMSAAKTLSLGGDVLWQTGNHLRTTEGHNTKAFSEREGRRNGG